MPGPSIRPTRSTLSALVAPWLGLLVLALFSGCSREGGPSTAAAPEAKDKPAAAQPAAFVPRTAALIDVDRTPAGALLEKQLSGSTPLTWLERENLAPLLREQELQALFSPQGGDRRAALGKLLKVDLLVLLRSVVDADGKQPRPMVHLVVCETRNGLRLCSRTLPVKELQACVAEMERQVRTALRKQKEEVRVIWAVPPFVSKDLRYQRDYLKAAYARLVEQVLLEQKGTQVVELAEAEAITREYQLTASEARPQRPLPFYLLGEFRTEQADGRRRVSVGLKLKQGERILGGAEKADLAADRVPSFLVRATEDFTRQAARVELHGFDPRAESAQLDSRARTFSKLGDWGEALALREASLLLEPSRATSHHEAALACSMLAQDYYWRNLHKKMSGGKFDPKKGDPKALALAFQYYLRGLEHEEAYLNEEGKSPRPLPPGNNAPTGRAMSFEVRDTSWALAQGRGAAPDLPEEYERMRQDERAILLRLTRQRARNGWGDEHRYLSLALRSAPSLRERFSLIRQMILELQELPWARQRTLRFTDTIRENSVVGIKIVQPYDSPEFQDFLKDLAAVPNKEVRAGVADVRKLAAQLHATAERRKKQESKVTAETRRPAPGQSPAASFDNAEAQFRPVSLAWKGPAAAAALVKVKGCLPVGPAKDCLWDVRSLYLMKEKGVLRPVWAGKERFRLNSVCYDGRYVWAGGYEDFGSPSLVILDPSSEKTWEVTARDGLPVLSAEERSQRRFILRKMAATPLESGMICLAGFFGRSWVATVSFDPVKEKATVKVVHEAREAPEATTQEKWKSPATAFEPSYIFTLSTPGGRPEKRVLVGRRSPGQSDSTPPLLIDPLKSTTEVMREKLLEMPPMAMALHQGKLYFVGPPVWSWEKKKAEHRLACIAFPGVAVETILPDVPPGWLVQTGGQLYLVGKGLWEVNLGERKLRPVVSQLPWSFNYLFSAAPQEMLESVFPSSHYGLLAVVRRFDRTAGRPHDELLQIVLKRR